ncbi:MAG TPA: tetratricopeptide repeat-containing serine protease family protein [Pyrinomonadaceae bacterium]|nr:tetratricopeptide repeat-containing serine protease family protein [Pyrinomonadaceae bacterium]
MQKNFPHPLYGRLPALLLLVSLAALTASAQQETTTRTSPAADAAAGAPAPPNASTNATAEGSLPDLVRRVKPAVVAVITYDAKGNTLLSGSGFFVRPGQVVTNLHVIEGARRAEIKTLDGKGRIYPVDGVLASDEEGDLALLGVSVPAERAHAVEVTNVLPEEGERVFVIGNPLRLEGSISDGIVSAVREVPNLGRIIQITAPVSHGNSGSPLFNMRGQVVGVVTIKVTNGQNINLAMSSARFDSLKATEPATFETIAAREKEPRDAESSADWWYKNGLNSLWLGNYDSALGSFENAVNKNPDRVEAWIQVGYCKVKQGKNADAIRAYKQALRLRPNSVEAYNKLGDAYYYAGSFDEALGAYRQAARLRPDLPEAFYNLGMTYLEIGDRAAALAQSRTLQPLDAELYAKLLSEIKGK